MNSISLDSATTTETLSDELLVKLIGTPEKAAATINELDRLDCAERLLPFVRRCWPVLEPKSKLVEGWALEAICEHLEAVTNGAITRLLINVPPGFMKSLLTNVFWPAWEWGPQALPHMRYVTFSYAAALTERDNGRFRDLVMSREFRQIWGGEFMLRKVGEQRVTNDKTGWKMASSVGGVGTGERGNRILLDDPHNVKEGESPVVRGETVRWFRESMSNRLNDQERSAIVIIMQRVHDSDVSGTILSEGMGYDHLMIPMEYDTGRRCHTSIGWEDPRHDEGALAWPSRFSPEVVRQTQIDLGKYAYASQYQQSPAPRKGGIFQREWWKLWPEDFDEKFMADGKPMRPLEYPPMEFIMASVDTAMSVREEADYSAMSVWGVWRDKMHHPRLMLMDAWHDRLEFNALVDRINKICRRRRVDRLLIEAKANGLSVAQEIARLCGPEEWGTTARPVKGDKVSRAYAVQHFLESGCVYAPDRRWADLLIDEMASFPRGSHDDLVDTATQAWFFMRQSGMMQTMNEADDERRTMELPPSKMEREPLYDV